MITFPSGRLLRIAAAAAAAAALGMPAGAAPQTIEQALADRFGLTAAERNTIAGGFEAARALPSAAPDGVAVIGAIRIDARPSVYLRWAETGVDFDRSAAVQAVRRLSDPPVLADFDFLTLSAEEVIELARCRIGACALQLDAGSISRVAAIDWRRPRAGAEATAIVRETMLDVAERYLASGNAGLPHYHDARRHTDVEENLASLVEEEAACGRMPEPLLAALSGHPRELPPEATGYLSWMTHGFGPGPTTRLNHTIVYRGEGELAGVVATKQLYASHYLHGGLEMRYVLADPLRDDRFVLVMVSRARSDGLTGVAGAIVGNTIRRGALHSLRAQLRFTRDAVEKRQRAGGTPPAAGR
ncbi:MAG TPA: hypothetical protein VFZ36_05580 [Vicinamibacterales bacterium]